jgi:very-short-patch-repair endonuclease
LQHMKEELSYNERKAVYINKRGLQQLISKSKVCGPDKLQQIVDAFDLQLFITPRKEHEHLEAIEKTFSEVKMYKQFRVGRYRVDLYIEEYNLVVECDEYNHTNYNRREEEERELFIKSELGCCDFIRFNPDAKEFSIFSVLGDIHKHILKIKDEIIDRQSHKIKLLKEQL